MSVVTLTGIRELRRELNRTAGRQVQNMTEAIDFITTMAASYSKTKTPIGGTGTLVSSQFTNVTMSGEQIVGEVGYSAPYASLLELASSVSSPGNPSGQPGFLKAGFEDSGRMALYDHIIESKLRT